MNKKTSRIFFGVLLIFIGALIFLSQFFHFDITGTVIAGIFVLVGIAFLIVYLRNPQNWWALIPGFTLAGIGGLIAMGEWLPKVTDVFGGSFFLLMIGLSFLIIYLTHKEFWWAIIPAGALFTLALVAFVANFDGILAGSVFFLGIAATFAVIGLMPVGKQDKWPWIPAGICAAIGLLISLGSSIMTSSFLRYFWPAALFLGGIYLIFRSVKK